MLPELLGGLSEALQDKIAALGKASPKDCVFYVLCGDSEVLPAPKDEEEDTTRGLSAMQIGMGLTDAFEAISMVPGPLVVCEFPRAPLEDVLPARANISSHQLSFLCEGQRCMQAYTVVSFDSLAAHTGLCFWVLMAFRLEGDGDLENVRCRWRSVRCLPRERRGRTRRRAILA